MTRRRRGSGPNMNSLIASYVTHLEACGRSPQTISSRRKLLLRLDDELPEGLDAISTRDLEEWLAPYTGWTLYTYHTGIRDFCRFAAQSGYEFDPSDALRRPRMPDHEARPATDHEVQVALGRLTGVPLTAVTLATYAGLRCAEVSGLMRSHVTAETIWVSRKGAKAQLLPTHPQVWGMLRDRPDGLVVATRSGRRFAPSYLSCLVSDALSAVGLPELTLHKFRATFATRLARAGVHITVIQSLMGHTNVSTTQRYIRVSDDQRRSAILAL
jgi:integrase